MQRVYRLRMVDASLSRPRDYFLLTNRLGFGHWSEGDLPLALELWGDPGVSSLIGGPFTESEIGARLNRERNMLIDHQVQYWPVFLLQSDDFAGCAGLRPYKGDGRIFEMGVHLKQSYQGQGLAQEAARAVIEFAFKTLRVRGLFAGHHPRNTASEHLIKRLGFCFTHEEFYAPTGENHPSYLLMNPGFPG
jgi:[ribosomal protein S5]-alanine N-acetyltransferase